MNFIKITSILLFLSFSISCGLDPAPSAPDLKADPHSFAQPNEVVAKHLDLNLKLDFDQKILTGHARWTIENLGADEIIFDTKNLTIEKITLGQEEKETNYFLVDPHEILGTALRVQIDAETDVVTIYYSTQPGAAALGWMEPSQTAGKKSPFLFTQGQAILTRSWIPCQDSPGIRVTYNATIQVPVGMMAVMSAENPQDKTADGLYHFNMPHPISPYLIALAVGDFAFKPVGARTGVYAEPPMLEKTAWEFADMEKMVEAAEALYGPYDWGRFDLIVLPPGFPFGGMENPMLTFATPTVLAGDRSLVALVAHELAHSWSGNLVTNATWNDFWLNEGFTVYFERRIMEALYGKEYVDMLALLEYHELADEVRDLGEKSPDTHLKLDLAGRDPDDGMNHIAYQKGAFFLQMLEEKTGRERFDAFLKSWFEENKFQAKTTEEFLVFLRKNLLDKYQVEADVDEWVYGPGIPANLPMPVSQKLALAEQAAALAASDGQLPATKDWTSHEWVHFIRHLPETVDVAALKKLDAQFNLTNSGNSEILAVWYETAIRRGYSPEILPNIENFLVNMGRRRFLVPLYRAFKESGQIETARRIFEKAKSGYHPVSYGSVQGLLN